MQKTYIDSITYLVHLDINLDVKIFLRSDFLQYIELARFSQSKKHTGFELKNTA